MVYATFQDVAARMDPAPANSQQPRIDVLCSDASDMIDEEWPDMAARIAAGRPSESSVRRIVAAMVRRAVQRPGGEGVQSLGQGVGPFNTNLTFSNPEAALFIRPVERSVLDGTIGETKAGRAFSVDLWQQPSGFCA